MNSISLILFAIIATVSLAGAIACIVFAFKSAKRNADNAISKNKKSYLALKAEIGVKPFSLAE